MLKNILIFFTEVLHCIGYFFPFVIYFIDMPKWLIIISFFVWITLPFIWFINNNKCVVSNIASDLSNDSRNFSEKLGDMLPQSILIASSLISLTVCGITRK